MKKTMLLLLAVATASFIFPQSNDSSSRELFLSLSKCFKEYDIKSEQTYKWEMEVESKNFRVKYNHPNLIITYTDDSHGWDFGTNFIAGTYTISIPIDDVVFRKGRVYWGVEDKEQMEFYSQSGMEIYFKGKKTLVQEVAFYASELVCDKLLSILQAFQKQVVLEEFKGKYGYPVENSTPKVKPQKISDEYEQ